MAHGLYMTIDLDKIEHNARAIVGLCQQHGIEVTGVTKGACGHPEVAKAMLRGGVASLGESRMENIYRLQAAGVRTSYMLLRIPPLSEVDEVVASVDVSLNSELSVLKGLSAATLRYDRIHDVILMVDLGALREGIWPDDLIPFVRETLKLSGVRIAGLGTNLTCFGGVVRSEDAFGHLPTFENHGEGDRTILNVGREDVDIAGIVPVDPRLKILGASSDYLVVDVTETTGRFHVGDEISFSLNYSALLAAMTSQYVEKRPLKGGVPVEAIL